MGVENRLKTIDRRTYQRNIEKGNLKDSDFQSYVKNLPDETANAQWVEMDLFETEIEADEESEDEEEDA